MQDNQKTVSQDGSDVFKTRGFQKIDRAVNQSIAVVKKVCAIEIPVYTAKIYEIDNPTKAENIQKTS